MVSGRLQITYVLRGLDRILYSAPPTWQMGTFEQDVEAEGRLVLSESNVTLPSELADAKCKLRGIAERFRLAVSWRTGCPLVLEQAGIEEPNFDPPSEAAFATNGVAGVRFDAELKPRDPPDEIEQLSAEVTRWVQTNAEIRDFVAHPDEGFKRAYLLIEELDKRLALPAADQPDELKALRCVRNFVSHPICGDRYLCLFVKEHLPDAVTGNDKLVARFDRTNIAHMNFVSQYLSRATELASALVNAAIEDLR